MNMSCRPNKILLLLAFLGVLWAAVTGCGGGGGESTSDNPAPATQAPTNFEQVYERQLTGQETSGTLAPLIKAKPDADGNVHFAFLTSGPSLNTNSLPPDHDLIANPFRFQIHHAVWNPTTQQMIGSEEIIEVSPPHTNDTPVDALDNGIDNCFLLGLGLAGGLTPVVVYQGGSRPQSAGGLTCNPFYQGDLMVAVRNGNVWEEYLGIQGDASVKNPFFTDGMAGMSGDVAVDSAGNIHMIVQHYYEWCDLHGTTFPDLVYVRQSPADLGNYQPAMEEYVDEHNIYSAGGGIQNAMGYQSKLLLDNNQQPVAVYFGTLANGSRVIRASRRINGQWQPETVQSIPDDYTVGYISPAIAGDGTLAVAYFLKQISDDADFGDHLCYAERQNDGTWTNTMVDYFSYCGNYCALAFDNNNRPAVVYYEEKPYTAYRERHDVKYAFFDGRDWQREVVSTDGRVGLYNSVWFDEANVAHISTYEQEAQRILVFRHIGP